MPLQDNSSSPWARESLIGAISALGSLVAAVALIGFETSKLISIAGIMVVASVILSIVAALTKIKAIHIEFGSVKKKRKLKKKKTKV